MSKTSDTAPLPRSSKRAAHGTAEELQCERINATARLSTAATTSGRSSREACVSNKRGAHSAVSSPARPAAAAARRDELLSGGGKKLQWCLVENTLLTYSRAAQSAPSSTSGAHSPPSSVSRNSCSATESLSLPSWLLPEEEAPPPAKAGPRAAPIAERVSAVRLAIPSVRWKRFSVWIAE